MLTVKNLLTLLEDFASFALAENWDNVGLMVGDPAREVSGVLVALDPTEEVLAEAVAKGMNTVVTHHPLIFHPVKAVYTDQPLGRFLQLAMEKGIAVIGCHSNLDQAPGGVNDVLAALLGLQDTCPITVKLVSTEGEGASRAGFGRYGCFAEPVSRDDFLGLLAEKLGLTVIPVAGRLPAEISRVAVCGGSGSDLAEAAFRMGAQVYITGEVKHSTARWAEASGFCVVDAGHFATENPVVPVLADHLRSVLAGQGVSAGVEASTSQGTPFEFYTMSGSLK